MLVIGYHLIWTAYGTWLPNDPRGSGSKAISSDVIAQLGDVHFGRKAVQPAGSEIRAFYDKATSLLQHEVRMLDATAIAVAGEGLQHAIEARNYTCYACAVMQDHVHVLIRKHRDEAETMLEELKAASAQRLREQSHWPAAHPF